MLGMIQMSEMALPFFFMSIIRTTQQAWIKKYYEISYFL